MKTVNLRVRSLILKQYALESHGFYKNAMAIKEIRKKENWSKYVKYLIRNVQQAVRKYSDVKKLRFLLYPKNLLSEDLKVTKKMMREWFGSR